MLARDALVPGHDLWPVEHLHGGGRQPHRQPPAGIAGRHGVVGLPHAHPRPAIHPGLQQPRRVERLRRQHGDAAGTRALIEVLLAHRTLPAAAVAAAMTRAIASRVLDAQAVIIDARRQAGRQVAPVIPIGALARYDRPAPDLDAYDQLLTRTIS